VQRCIVAAAWFTDSFRIEERPTAGQKYDFVTAVTGENMGIT